MVKRKLTRMKNESCDDPRELLLSLVDLGSIDSDEMLLACVSEMSDAECKRVLNSLSLPTGAGLEDEDDVDDIDFDDADVEPADDTVLDDADDLEDDGTDEGDADEESEDVAELEARIRKLERTLSNESRRRFDRR